MIGWDDVLALTRDLPEVEESTSYGRPALKVRGTMFVALRERPGALVVRCDGDEKPFLLEARPDLVFTTPHYDGWPYLLVRLDAPPEEVRELLIDSFVLVAPKRLADTIELDRRRLSRATRGARSPRTPESNRRSSA